MKSSNIGGQAVLEGIMMKHQDEYAVAVRKPNGEIAVEKNTYQSVVKWEKLTKTPFIRGVFNFIDSMVLGIRTLMFSATFFEEEEEALSKEEAEKRDIQRTYMYHGAEHKCINCIEHGLPLTVENVKKSSRQHKRCGTSFLFLVLAISIILFMMIRVESAIMRLLIRIILLPVIAGISYEVLKLAGRSDNFLINLISKPGLAIQKLTTKEPDDSMIEVAIQAVEAVFDWRAYEAENFGITTDL